MKTNSHQASLLTRKLPSPKLNLGMMQLIKKNSRGRNLRLKLLHKKNNKGKFRKWFDNSRNSRN